MGAGADAGAKAAAGAAAAAAVETGVVIAGAGACAAGALDAAGPATGAGAKKSMARVFGFQVPTSSGSIFPSSETRKTRKLAWSTR